MKKAAMIVFAALVLSLAGCAAQVSDQDTSGSALARDIRAADCDRQARTLTSPEESMASAPWLDTPWRDANEWALSTSGSKAQIERDLRWRYYADCTGINQR